MQAVITGDIVNSQKIEPEIWLENLKAALAYANPNSKEWEIYRGDEFQLFVENAEDAFLKILTIKSHIKTVKDLDVRMSIGIGTRNFEGDKITLSNGSVFVNSGRNFEQMRKEKELLGFQSGDANLDQEVNLMLEWASQTMDTWSVVSAEIVHLFLTKSPNQEQAADILNISQSSVSQRLKRSNYDLLMKTESYFRTKIKHLQKA